MALLILNAAYKTRIWNFKLSDLCHPAVVSQTFGMMKSS
jgi:hypothetical protein